MHWSIPWSMKQMLNPASARGQAALEHLKTIIAIVGALCGILGLGATFGRNGEVATVRADLSAHLSPGYVHPEAVRQFTEIKADVREVTKAVARIEAAATATQRAVEKIPK